ncbi:sporulation protein YqfC [Effusibacillus lacus]|uniref:Sporulation protein YqfC n=1 Tax=Effusibacillus lacus TaxID=1348429 RepID=A0A292YNK9_9BACL|nr:sporulation protein YqfC [Effusibacillus lacus]TCS70364.1 sporulation protein YqfC [Effusibacillus lacus]GAX91518.1 sporulation protein YqfC [Effusibacillus lacus]
MQAFNRFKNLAANLLELPKDAIYDVPRITLMGGLQLVVENHTGILEFHNSRIRLAHSTGVLVITGKNLMIKNIQPKEILVEGEIKGIQFA